MLIPDHYEPVGIFVVEWTQENRVDDREDSCVDSYSKRKRHDRHDRKSPLTQERPDRISNVLNKRMKHMVLLYSNDRASSPSLNSIGCAATGVRFWEAGFVLEQLRTGVVL